MECRGVQKLARTPQLLKKNHHIEIEIEMVYEVISWILKGWLRKSKKGQPDALKLLLCAGSWEGPNHKIVGNLTLHFLQEVIS